MFRKFPINQIFLFQKFPILSSLFMTPLPISLNFWYLLLMSRFRSCLPLNTGGGGGNVNKKDNFKGY